MPANASKTLFLLLTRLATCTQCVLNEKKVSKYTPSNFGLQTRGSSESSILIFGCVLACTGSVVNKVTDYFGVDINSELTRKRRNISVKYVLTLCSSSGLLTPDTQTVMSSA